MEGKATVIQATGSDVSLHVPEGVHGEVNVRTFTNPSMFSQYLKEDECLVSPVTQVTVSSRESQKEPKGNFIVRIKHMIRDVFKARKHIKVRQGDFRQGAGPRSDEDTVLLRERKDSSQSGNCYDIDKDYITIETKKPGSFIVTVEGINCCSGCAAVHLFGSMKFPDNQSLATVKVYFSGAHTGIEDYKTVSNLGICWFQ